MNYHLIILTLAISFPASLLAEKPPSRAAAIAATETKPHTPKIGSPERKAILKVMRAEVAADQKREDPAHPYPPAVFTILHFNVQGDWAFVDATMKPDYAENAVMAVLQRVQGKWQIKSFSLADDVTHYGKLAKKLAAPRSLFPTQKGL
jgi:hypothetical protein